MKASYSSNNLNRLIEFNKADKLCHSIAKLSYQSTPLKEEIATGFFIKLPNNEKKEAPFFCTAKHALKIGLTEVFLTLNKKDEYDENYEIKISLKPSEKTIIDYIIYDIIFIEILDKEIPDNLLSFLKFEKDNLYDPNKYINYQAIMAHYPKSYLTEDGNNPLISHGNIIKIQEENGIIQVVYEMTTDTGSSGAPICIIDQNGDFKLIAIHNRHDKFEKDNYNIGNFLGPIIDMILNENRINVNINNEINNVENIIKRQLDQFDNLISKEFLEDNFITDDKYQKIIFYHKQIKEEYKNQYFDRFIVYYCLLNNHILSYAHDKFGESMNEILTILNNFRDIQSTFEMIKTFNEEIITNFNTILLSDDYILKANLIYFISAYIQTLKEKDYTYKYRDVSLYQRSLINLDVLNKLKAKTNKIVTNQYFMEDIIPMTRLGTIYKQYYDLSMTLWIGCKKYLSQILPTDYDTIIYIEQKIEDSNNQEVNIFKISYWPKLIIAPFSFFKVNLVEINNYNQTAVINLTLVTKRNSINDLSNHNSIYN